MNNSELQPKGPSIHICESLKQLKRGEAINADYFRANKTKDPKPMTF